MSVLRAGAAGAPGRADRSTDACASRSIRRMACRAPRWCSSASAPLRRPRGKRISWRSNAPPASVAKHLTAPVAVVSRSPRFPPAPHSGFARSCSESGRELRDGIEVVSNPEFLREGRAVEDSVRPDRLLVGAPSERGFATMRRLYEPSDPRRHPPDRDGHRDGRTGEARLQRVPRAQDLLRQRARPDVRAGRSRCDGRRRGDGQRPDGSAGRSWMRGSDTAATASRRTSKRSSGWRTTSGTTSRSSGRWNGSTRRR